MIRNRYTTLHADQNVRYFIHKYDIVSTDWFENVNILYKILDMYAKHNSEAESYYVGTSYDQKLV